MKVKLYSRAFGLLLVSLFSYSLVSAQTAPMKTSKGNDQTLQVSRKKIDSLDKALIALLGERERVVKEIGVYKAKNNIPALQADRFKQVIEKSIEAGKKESLSETFVTELMNAIHKESLRIEEEIKAQK
ncbi:chorismate mutase [Mucilaginibacter lappiensis]|uniref:chorismate mutase n=1 Tax=Mucilaginibacter lappiensis TaxID=354630 RepID=A0ABR6PQL2_9SPHI|nr:chorismate mutase [Mucilaginibacter lappiensis]MBB6112062.1 chorismate mutase [Mucilaginibacter lappiensis]SIR95264.1 chorismate mutase [Mucilaginibacter lappiensis]